MKQLSALIVFMMACMPLTAQDKTQGKVTYNIRVNIHANLKPDQQQYKDMIPEFMEREAVYIFKGRHGLAKGNKEETEDTEGEVTVKMKFGNDNDVTYVDMDTKKNMQLVNVKDKQYLFTGSDKEVKEDAIKLQLGGKEEKETGETKNILGYDCKKIVAGSGKNKITYWYTDALPILGGAIGIMSEKGLVLEMESGTFSFKAKSLQFQPIADADVLPPPGLTIINDLKDAK